MRITPLSSMVADLSGRSWRRTFRIEVPVVAALIGRAFDLDRAAVRASWIQRFGRHGGLPGEDAGVGAQRGLATKMGVEQPHIGCRRVRDSSVAMMGPAVVMMDMASPRSLGGQLGIR